MRRDLACLGQILSLPAMVLAGVNCLVCNCVYRRTEQRALVVAAWVCMIAFELSAAVYVYARSRTAQHSDVQRFALAQVSEIVLLAILAVITLLLFFLYF